MAGSSRRSHMQRMRRREIDVVGSGCANATVRNVVVTPIGHVAVGAIGTDAAAWRSTDDGATWAAYGNPVPEAYFHNAFVSDGDLLLLGVTQTGTVETGIDSRAMIWLTDMASDG